MKSRSRRQRSNLLMASNIPWHARRSAGRLEPTPPPASAGHCNSITGAPHFQFSPNDCVPTSFLP